MSKEIYEKVVEMRFDSKQFEQGVSSTMKTLDKLKQSLKFTESAKAFENIETASKNVHFTGLIKAVNDVETKITSLKNQVSAAMDPLKQQFSNLGSYVIRSAETTSANLKTIVSSVSESFVSLTTPVLHQTDQIANAVSSSFSQAASALSANTQNSASQIQSTVSSASSGISNAISSVVKTLAITAGAAAVVVGGVVLVSSQARDKIKTIALNVKEALVSAAETIREKLSSVAATIKETLSSAADNIKSKIETVTTGIREHLSNVINTIRSWMETNIPGIYNLLSNAADSIRTKIEQVSTEIQNRVVAVCESIKQKIQNVGEEIHSAISDVVERIKEKFLSVTTAFDEFKNKLTSKFKKQDLGLDEVSEGFETLGERAKEAEQKVSEASEGIVSSIEETKSAVSDIGDKNGQIESTINEASDAIDRAADDAKDKVSDVGKTVSEESEDASESVSEGADEAASSFETIAEKVKDSSSWFDKLGEIGGVLKSKFSGFGKDIGENLGKVGEKIKECVTGSGNLGKTIKTVFSVGLPLVKTFSNTLKSHKAETDNSNTAMENLGSAVQTVASKFTNLGIMGQQALKRIANQALSTGERLIKSLSVDNIKAGWDKFGEKTTSVATLVAQGYDLDTVNEQLEQLNWFTDETSYNFTDMVGEIGKFTASGQNLEDSVTAMKGIASWAALSGQNAATASRAMYQLSQAMGAGVMRKEDYKSIQNVSMDTMEFRQKAIDAAVALGTLKDNADGTYTSIVDGAKTSTFTIKQFAENLTEEQWFTSDVMMSVYKDYGKASNTVMAYVDKYSNDAEHKIDTASKAMDDIEEKAQAFVEKMNKAGKEITLDEALKKVSLDEMKEIPEVVEKAEQYMEEYNATLKDGEEPLTSMDEALEKLGYGLDEFSLKALRAGQEARTWKDVVDSVKDAVSTGWMNTFEKIFGNYEEAKELWTTAANELYDVFAAGGEVRNEILGTWKELGGRDDLLAGVMNTWNAFKDILQSVKDAFREVFLGTTDEDTIVKMLSESLADLTKRFKDFTEKFKMGDETAEKLKTTFKGLFAAIDIVRQVLSKAFSTIKPLFGMLPGMGNGVLGLTSNIGEFLIKIDEFLKTNPKLQEVLGKIREGFGNVAAGISSGLEKIGSFWDVIKVVFEKIKGFVSQVFFGISSALTAFNGNIKNFFNVAVVGLAIKRLLKVVTGTTTKFGRAFKNIKEQVTEILDSVKDCLESFQRDIKANTLLKIAAAVGILAVSILLLASIDPSRLGSALGAFTVAFGELMGAMAIFTKIADSLDSKKTGNIDKLVAAMIGMSAAVLILSLALKTIGNMEPEAAVQGLIGVSVLMTELVLVCKKLSAMQGEIVKGMAGILIFAIAIRVLVMSVKALGKLDVMSLVQGVAGVSALIWEFVGVIAVLSKMKGKMAQALPAVFAMTVMAVALRIAVSSVKALAVLSTGELVNGLFGVAGILMIFTTIVGVLSNLKESATTAIPGAVAIALLAVALKIATKPFMELGMLAWDQIAKGFVSMLAILGLFAGVVAMCSAFGAATLAAIPGALAMVVMAGVLKMAVEPFYALGMLEWDQIGKGVVSMLAILGFFAGVIALCAAFSVATLAAIPGALAMVAMAFALKTAVGPFTELGNMEWDQIGKGIVAMLGVIGVLGTLGTVLGVVSPLLLAGSVALLAMALSLQAAVTALASALVTFLACTAMLSLIKPDEFSSAIIAVSEGIAILGVALLAFNPLSLAGAASMLVLANAIATLVPPLISLSKDADMEKIAVGMTVLSLGMAEFGLAMNAFSPLAIIGAAAMLELGTSIAIMAPAIALLAAVPGDGVKTMLDTLAKGFKDFGEALKETPFWGAKSRAQGIGTLVDSIKSLGEGLAEIAGIENISVSTVLTDIGEGFKAFGEALKETPFWGAKSRGEGIGTLVNSIKMLGEGLAEIAGIEDISVSDLLKDIGEGFKAFGEALNSTPAFNSKSGAQGISTLVDAIDELSTGLSALSETQMNGAAIKTKLTSIGEGLQSFATALNYGPMWGAEGNAAGISTIVGSITTLANGVKQFETITDIEKAKEDMTSLATAFSEFGSSVANAPLFNADERANSIKTIIDSIKNLVPTVKDLAGLEQDKEKITGILTSLGESMKNFGSAVTKVPLFNSDGRGNALSTVLQSVNSLSSAVQRLQTMSSDDIGAIGTALSNVITAINTASSGFSEGTSSAFSATATALAKLAPTLQQYVDIDATTISSNLSAVSTALTTFASSTTGIGESLETFSTMGSTAATNFVTGYSEALEAAAENFQSAGESAVNSYNNGMENKKTAATTTATSIGSACVTAIRGKYKDFYNAGVYVITGFNNGLKSEYDTIVQTATYLVDGFVNAIQSQESLDKATAAGEALGEAGNTGAKNALDENSPSKVMYKTGEYGVLGFVNAFKDGLTMSEVAGSDLAYNAIDGASFALERASAILNDDLELQPTIRPVIDLSDVQNGVSTLNGLFGGSRGISVNTSTRLSRLSAMTMSGGEVSGAVVKNDNSDVVSAIHILRSDVNALSQKIEGMQVTIDGKKAVGALTSRMDKSLGKVQINRKRGV